MSTLKLDLTKSAEKLRLSLDKAGVSRNLTMELAFDLDVSGSFEDEHKDGITNTLMARLVPWGMVFDPNKQIDVFTFSNGRAHVHHVGVVTSDDHENYVARKVIGKVPGWCGGTDYSYVIEQNLERFGWIQTAPSAPESGGFFKKMFGGTRTPSATPTLEKKRSLVIFVTDGDPSREDRARTIETLRQSEERGDQVYFLLIGISNQGGAFEFLQELADKFGNTGLVIIRDLNAFVEQTDEALNATLLGDELVAWLKK